jgi:hypothetical protein
MGAAWREQARRATASSSSAAWESAATWRARAGQGETSRGRKVARSRLVGGRLGTALWCGMAGQASPTRWVLCSAMVGEETRERREKRDKTQKREREKGLGFE